MAHRNAHWKRHATAPCIHILPKEPELLAILKVYVWTFMIVNSAYKTPFLGVQVQIVPLGRQV